MRCSRRMLLWVQRCELNFVTGSSNCLSVLRVNATTLRNSACRRLGLVAPGDSRCRWGLDSVIADS